MAVVCDIWRVGSQDFSSDLVLCLESVVSPAAGELDITVSAENVPVTGGGFLFQPQVEVRVNGVVEATYDFGIDFGQKDSRTTTVTGVADVENATVELAVVGDFASGCWCTGDRVTDCSITSPTADCMTVSHTGTATGTESSISASTVLALVALFILIQVVYY